MRNATCEGLERHNRISRSNLCDIIWLIDVIAPTKKATGQVVGNFKNVVKDGELRLHPVVGQLLDKETLEKLGMKRDR